MAQRDVSYLKPPKFKDWLTITELSRRVKRDVSRLRQLEREDRIPRARRVKCGKLYVRLWSPPQVEEIESIIAAMRPGRPRRG